MWRIDEELLTRLWETLGSSTFPGRDLFEPPDREVLRELLRVALAASLTTEEARPTRFNLAYLSGRGAAIEHDFVLAAPLPFDVENLRRLAPILDGPFAFLVVREIDAKLVIVGGFRCVQPLEPWSRGVPAGLLLAASGPAELAVSLCGSQLLSTSAGEVTWASRGVARDLDLYNVIDGALALDKGERLASREAPTLLRLARAMLAHRHGGTLLVLVKGIPADGLEIRYGVSSGGTGLKSREPEDDDAAGLLDDPHSALECARRSSSLLKFEESLRAVASLTAVDGAVVLDSDLTLRGFGAIIADARPDSKVPDVKEVAFNAYGSPSAREVRRGGTRHQSAARFVDLNRCHSLAFVASQDGMLSLWVGCADGTVVVIRPIGPFAYSR